MTQQTLTREQLYNMVWSIPISLLAKTYKITDFALRKACIRMSVPLPLAGHWAKIKLGKQVVQPPLPAYTAKQKEIVLELRTTTLPNNSEKPSGKKQKKAVQESTEDKLLQVSERLSNPDPIVVAVRDSLNERSSNRENEPVNTSLSVFNLSVTKALIPRALRLLDCFIKNIKSRGYSIVVSNYKSEIVIKDQHIEIAIREKTRKSAEKTRWGSTQYEPTGQLIFKMGSWLTKEWMDSSTIKLEEKLPAIITKLEMEAQEKYEWKLEAEKKRKEQERLKAIRIEFEKCRDADLSHFIDALQQSTRWHKVTNLRNYLDEFETRAIANGSLTLEVQAWLQRSRQQADWYDPFISTNDELLDEINKETLVPPKPKYSYW